MNIRGNARLLALLTASLLATTACGGDKDESASPATSASADAVASASPTDDATDAAADEATPEQMATVIAGYERDWREVIDNAADCRWDWTISDDATAELRGMTCYLNESTIGLTTETAAAELGALTPPSSMTTLIEETNAALARVHDIDLEGVCGDPVVGPNDTKRCSTTLGQRMGAYSELETALDQWGPYL